MSLYEMAREIQNDELTAPQVSEPINPPEHESPASTMLSEMEERKGFDRSQPSMEYQGSESNRQFVQRIIREKYGDDEAEAYEPCVQAKPKTEWLKLGYIIKEDSPLCTIPTIRGNTMIDCDLWHQNQVEKC